MKSVQIDTFSSDVTHISLREAPIPEPGPGQVRVRMRMSPVNPSDFNQVHGTYHQALQRVLWNHGKGDKPSFDPLHCVPCPVPPYSLGNEGVGIVEASGGGLLARRLVGKRVAVASGPPHGTWQEYTLADAKKCIALPDDIDDEQGAMFFVNPITAYALTREVLKVPPGAWLLITAAGSALGKSVVRLSKHFGFKTLCVLRDSTHTHALRALGADAIVETDTQDLIAEVHRITGGMGVGHAMDAVGGELAAQVLRCLGLNGHLVLYGTLANAPMPLTVRDLMMPLARISGFLLPNWLTQQSLLKRIAVIRTVTSLTRKGMFHSEVTDRFPITEIQSAIAAARLPGRSGKVMLTMGLTERPAP
jgi:NADPH:quinone reductase-like Zn-dependent oxidoreductase